MPSRKPVRDLSNEAPFDSQQFKKIHLFDGAYLCCRGQVPLSLFGLASFDEIFHLMPPIEERVIVRRTKKPVQRDQIRFSRHDYPYAPPFTSPAPFVKAIEAYLNATVQTLLQTESVDDYPFLEFFANHPNARFNSTLINLYRNGQDYISSHSDNVDVRTPVASLTYYQASSPNFVRAFCIEDKKTRYRIYPPNESLMVMCGPRFHLDSKHSVPRIPLSLMEYHNYGPRINITVRVIFDAPFLRALVLNKKRSQSPVAASQAVVKENADLSLLSHDKKTCTHCRERSRKEEKIKRNVDVLESWVEFFEAPLVPL